MRHPALALCRTAKYHGSAAHASQTASARQSYRCYVNHAHALDSSTSHGRRPDRIAAPNANEKTPGNTAASMALSALAPDDMIASQRVPRVIASMAMLPK